MLIIDCHAHIHGEDEKRYPTIDNPYRPPQGTGTLEHLRREMKAAGVAFVAAIQTSTFYRWDNRFTTDSARASPDWMVGVCTLDPDDPHSPGLLQEYVRDSNVRGMRSVPAANGKLDHPGVIKLWETAEQLGIVINVLVNRDRRDEISALLQRLAEVESGPRSLSEHQGRSGSGCHRCRRGQAGPASQPARQTHLHSDRQRRTLPMC